MPFNTRDISAQAGVTSINTALVASVPLEMPPKLFVDRLSAIKKKLVGLQGQVDSIADKLADLSPTGFADVEERCVAIITETKFNSFNSSYTTLHAFFLRHPGNTE